MDMNEALSLYCDKSDQEKMKILARLSHQLTILARGTYELESDDLSAPKKLRCINEIMHRVLGQLNKYLNSDSSRYPDQLFIKMIFDMAGSCQFEDELLSGFTDTFEFCR